MGKSVSLLLIVILKHNHAFIHTKSVAKGSGESFKKTNGAVEEDRIIMSYDDF